jgi:hypothetical protein
MRDQILNSTLTLPSHSVFLNALGSHQTEVAERFFQALWHNYLKDKSATSLPYWSEQFESQATFNVVLKSLAKAGWIIAHSIPARNWAESQINEDKLLQYVSIDELEQVRAHNKFIKYRLTQNQATTNNSTRINGRTKDTGLVREGFRKSANTKWQYDVSILTEYQPVVQANLTKSMDKIAEMYPELRSDRASYDTISTDILHFHLHSFDKQFSAGERNSDSRGRNISGALSKVANPISCKDFRASIIIPKTN